MMESITFDRDCDGCPFGCNADKPHIPKEGVIL